MASPNGRMIVLFDQRTIIRLLFEQPLPGGWCQKKGKLAGHLYHNVAFGELQSELQSSSISNWTELYVRVYQGQADTLWTMSSRARTSFPALPEFQPRRAAKFRTAAGRTWFSL